jgi:hypothetical protein
VLKFFVRGVIRSHIMGGYQMAGGQGGLERWLSSCMNPWLKHTDEVDCIVYCVW